MSAEVKKEIAHVLFIAIAGYSDLLINQQSELLRKLNGIVSLRAHRIGALRPFVLPNVK